MRPLLAALLLVAGPLAAQTATETDDLLPGLGDGPLPEFTLQVEDLTDEITVDELVGGDIIVEELTVGPGTVETLGTGRSRTDIAPAVAAAPGAHLRGLDKVSGEVTDMDLAAGQSAAMGRLTVELGECRYPVDNPAGDAFAYVTIRAEGLDTPAFQGWMVAASPALSALEHPRYDVWVIRCNNV